MKLRFICFGLCTVQAGTVLAADPTVSNIRASQRPGTTLVDLYYDLSGSTTPATVTAELSGDSGASYALSAPSLTGHVGVGVAMGANRHIVWNVGVDKPNFVSSTMRFRITATAPGPAPEGFVLIPAGSFSMGDALDNNSDEKPVHTVTLSAFFIAKTECTKAQWDDVRTWGLAHGYSDLYAGASKAATHPVQKVSWLDIVKWRNAASEKAGLTPCYTVSGAVMRTGTSTPTINYAASGYRLPTEAEWEKAARGDLSGRRFPWGDTITHSQANYNSYEIYAYDVSPTRGYHPTYSVGGVTPYTSPVGSFAANGYGLHDMAGNVWEWCGDWSGSAYYASSPASNPTGPTSGAGRVIRGGGWAANADNCRVALRYNAGPSGAATTSAASASAPPAVSFPDEFLTYRALQ